MSLIRKHVAVLQAWACLALVVHAMHCIYKKNNETFLKNDGLYIA